MRKAGPLSRVRIKVSACLLLAFAFAILDGSRVQGSTVFMSFGISEMLLFKGWDGSAY